MFSYSIFGWGRVPVFSPLGEKKGFPQKPEPSESETQCENAMRRLVPIIDISSWIGHPPPSVSDINLAQQHVVDEWHNALTTVSMSK